IVVQTAPFYLEVCPAAVNKGVGLLAVCGALGIDPAQAIAFGDSQNDTEMMNFAGLSVCMGNGTDDIKAISDYVTGKCSEDGIYDALEHFEII
ncbi:MAG: HAD hydrolase family protein, partial [Erysipelotrichaceae bacterium]|nr:HAD hydrolase family protein [Erysipelotrichaceae bacterium]